MQTLQPIIAGHPFFRELAPAYLELIAGCAKNVRFDSGQFIFRESAAANEFYLLRQGKVALEIFVPGRGPVAIQTVSEGEVLGWSWLFSPYHWRFSARALALTRALAFDGQCLRQKCDENHDLGYELMQRFAQIMAERLQATRLQLLDLYQTPRQKS
jgi:CRP-like cAMP-binding protein